MKKITSIIALSLFTSLSYSQFTVGSGGFTIKTEATVVINRLHLQPSADVNIANNTMLVSNVPVPGSPNGSIARVYQWDEPISIRGFTGIYVQVPGELNGNNFNLLQLAYTPTGNTNDYTLPAGGQTDAVTGLVYHNSLPLITWKHLTAVESGTALPLHLLSFTGTKSGSTVQLQWLVAGEKDMERYIVQHSSDGTHFDFLGEVRAGCNGCSNNTTYELKDHKPSSGNNYYRLQMVPDNGSIDYSQIVKIYFEQSGPEIVLNPNPATGKTWLSGLYTDRTYRLQVFTADGRQILHTNIQPIKGTYQLETSSWIPGTYFIRLQLENGTVYPFKLVRL